MDVASLGSLLEEQHQPGPDEESSNDGNEHSKEAVVLEDCLHP